MFIKKYDFYKFGYEKYVLNFRFEDNDNIPYSVTSFLKEIYPYNSSLSYSNYIHSANAFSKIGVLYGAEVTLDQQNNLIYISDADGDDYRIRTKDLTSDMIITFCINGSLEYDIMTKNNFIHLVSSWVQLLEHEPKFGLLYQDDNDWYDVIPFDSQEAMEKFVAEHTQKEVSISDSM